MIVFNNAQPAKPPHFLQLGTSKHTQKLTPDERFAEAEPCSDTSRSANLVC